MCPNTFNSCSTIMAKVAVCTRPSEMATRSFFFRGKNEFATREPFIPIIQSASEREYAASRSAEYSSPSSRSSHAC